MLRFGIADYVYRYAGAVQKLQPLDGFPFLISSVIFCCSFRTAFLLCDIIFCCIFRRNVLLRQAVCILPAEE